LHETYELTTPALHPFFKKGELYSKKLFNGAQSMFFFLFKNKDEFSPSYSLTPPGTIRHVGGPVYVGQLMRPRLPSIQQETEEESQIVRKRK
jgi:hypothetical protein